MGTTAGKPVVSLQDIQTNPRTGKRALQDIHQQFISLSQNEQTLCQNSWSKFLQTHFGHLHPLLLERIDALVRFKRYEDGSLDEEEFTCFIYVLKYASKEDQLLFLFSLFSRKEKDKGNGNSPKYVSKKDLSSFLSILLCPSSNSNTMNKNTTKEEVSGKAIDTMVRLILQEYDPLSHSSLSFIQWKRYAEEDPLVLNLYDQLFVNSSSEGNQEEYPISM